MIISRTPFRISLVGGGSDIDAYYKKNEYGSVVSATINKYMYIMIHPYFQDKIRLKYSKTEDVENVDQIQHPIIRECLKKVGVKNGIEIASISDVPAGTGLGSSSAFTVGLLNALYKYNGIKVTKRLLAENACDIEINKLCEPIGKQDQFAVAYGGINQIFFYKDESVNVNPISISNKAKKEIEQNLILVYTKCKRKAAEILEGQKKKMSDTEFASTVKELVRMSEYLANELKKMNYDEIGKVLKEGWEIKKKLSKNMTNEAIEDIYKAVVDCGAKGVKLLGAGGGGFFLAYGMDEKLFNQKYMYRTLKFKLESKGSEIIFDSDNHLTDR